MSIVLLFDYGRLVDMLVRLVLLAELSACCKRVGALVRAHMNPSGISSKPSPIHICINELESLGSGAVEQFRQTH